MSMTTDQYVEQYGTSAQFAAATGFTLPPSVPAQSFPGSAIIAHTITANEIDAASITTAILVAGSITAGMISVTSLSAISANMGAITAGTITLTGSPAYIRTSASLPYTEITGNGAANPGLTAYNAAGNVVTAINSVTGKIIATGIIIAEPGSNLPAGSVTGQLVNAQIADLAISTSKIQAKAVDTSKLIDALATSINTTYSNSNEAATDIVQSFGVGGSIVASSTAQTGSSVLRIVNATEAIYSAGSPIPVDPNSLYRIRARVRQNADPTSGSKDFYIGFVCYDNTLTPTGEMYTTAFGQTLAASSAWTTFTGYVRGVNAGSTQSPSPDPSAPNSFPVGTKFIRPIVYANWITGTGSQFDVDLITVDQIEIPDNVVTAAKVYSGTVQTLRLQANNIAANAITANSIAAIIGGGNIIDNSGFEISNQDGSYPAAVVNTSVIPSWIAAPAGTAATVSSPVKGGARAGAFTTHSSTPGTYLNAQANNTGANSIEPGKVYTFSAYVRSASTPRIANLYLYWLDASGANLLVSGVIQFSTTSGSKDTTNGTVTSHNGTGALPYYASDMGGITTTGVWQRVRLTVIAPVGAFRAAPVVNFVPTSGNLGLSETHYVDYVQLEEGEVPTQWNPKTQELGPGVITGTLIRAGTIVATNMAADSISATALQAGAVTARALTVGTVSDNLIANGGFEQFDAGTLTPYAWYYNYGTGGAVTSTTGQYTEGAYGLALVGTASLASTAIPVNPGDTYIVRCKLKHSDGTGTYYVRIQQDAAVSTTYCTGTNGFTDLALAVPNSSITGSFFTKEYIYTVPAGTKYISVTIWDWTSSGSLYVDEVEFRKQLGTTRIDGLRSTQ